MTSWLKRVDAFVASSLRWAVILCLAGVLILVAAGIVVRALPGIPYSWVDEIIEPLIGWLVFLGAATLWREKLLFTVNLVEQLVPPRVRRFLHVLIAVASLMFAVTFFAYSIKFTATSTENSPFLDFPKLYWYLAMPVSGMLMTAYSLRDIWQALTGTGSAHSAVDVGSAL